MNNYLNISDQVILKDSIFRIGKVFSVEGRMIRIKVDKQKNASHLLYKGNLLKNVGVGGYVKIIKGFISIIGKVESENIVEDKTIDTTYSKAEDLINRFLNVTLLGYIDNASFERGIKELPLIDNECFLLDKNETEIIHDFVKSDDDRLRVGELAMESGIPIHIGTNSFFASHIGIFGNTGSGKSYSLARLYRTLLTTYQSNSKFKENAKFLLFDFNGEYNSEDSIISDKHVINLNTKKENGQDKLVFEEKDLLNIELFSIIANATEKTQQPFLKRTLNFYKTIFDADNPSFYFKNVVRKRIGHILCMTDKTRAYLLLDYLRELLPKDIDNEGVETDLIGDISWHGMLSKFYPEPYDSKTFFETDKEKIKDTRIFKQVEKYSFPEDILSRIIDFLYLQLISDVLNNRAQNEHIAPVINKLKSFQRDFDKVIKVSTDSDNNFWNNNNFIVINLNDANLSIKKIIPLLVSYKLYTEHKNQKSDTIDKYLNIIIDEAHNILSYESQRESDSWKDYRLETFEEIIKEGRKFGVFLTIASQRPSDISPTIISQLHNFLLHRLINNRDIQAVEKTISYLDKVSFDSLPILPTGVCILTGIMAQIPVIVKIDRIEEKHEPNNKTIDLISNWIDNKIES